MPIDPNRLPDTTEFEDSAPVVPQPVRRQRPHWLSYLSLIFAAFPWLILVALVWPRRPYYLDMVAVWTQGAWWLSGIITIGYLIIRHWRGTVMCLAGWLGLTICLLSYQQGSFTVPRTDDMVILRVITFNAHGGKNLDVDGFVRWALAHEVDALNVDERWPDFRNNSQLRQRLPYVGPHRFYPILCRYPLQPIRNWDVTLIRKLSAFFPVRRIMINERQAILWVSAHPPSPRTAHDWQENLQRTRFLADHMRHGMQIWQEPAILTGDLNASPFSRCMENFSSTAEMRDVASNWMRRGTWPAFLPTLVTPAIDHVFVSSNVHVVRTEVGPNFGSDHRPVFTELAIRLNPNPQPPNYEGFDPGTNP